MAGLAIIIWICLCCKSVANCDKLATYKGGQCHRFYRTATYCTLWSDRLQYFNYYTVITLAIPCTHSNFILKYTCPLQFSLHLQRFKPNQSHIILAVETSTHLEILCFWVVVWCQLLTIHVLPHLKITRCLPHLDLFIYLNHLYQPVFLNPDYGTDMTCWNVSEF